jgi:hypothetical protein
MHQLKKYLIPIFYDKINKFSDKNCHFLIKGIAVMLKLVRGGIKYLKPLNPEPVKSYNKLLILTC